MPVARNLSDSPMVRPLGAETGLEEDRDALSNTYLRTTVDVIVANTWTLAT